MSVYYVRLMSCDRLDGPTYHGTGKISYMNKPFTQTNPHITLLCHALLLCTNRWLLDGFTFRDEVAGRQASNCSLWVAMPQYFASAMKRFVRQYLGSDIDTSTILTRSQITSIIADFLTALRMTS